MSIAPASQKTYNAVSFPPCGHTGRFLTRKNGRGSHLCCRGFYSGCVGEERRKIMKNKNLILALIALMAVAAVMVGILFITNSFGDQGAKTITVTVVHGDGTEKTFTYRTGEEYLGAVLYAEGLIVESASAGMFDTVDGEKADWSVDQSYWALYIGDDYATTGVDTTPIHDGDSFKLVYTRG